MSSHKKIDFITAAKRYRQKGRHTDTDKNPQTNRQIDRHRLYQQKADVDILNAIKNVLTDEAIALTLLG